MILKRLMFLFFSFTTVFGLTQQEIRTEYERYLKLFNKKEQFNSFTLFSENYRRVYTNNYFQSRLYLTQHSDEHVNEFVALPYMYVYLLDSRRGKEILICS